MRKALVAILGKLTNEASNDIDLVVHSYRLGSPSPCIVIEDFSAPKGIGGSIQSLDQIFGREVANHPGYVVKHRVELFVNYEQTQTYGGMEAEDGTMCSVELSGAN